MIQATIPAGVSALTVHGLHQWDYGQKLQLQADGLPNLIEVHFGCPGMKEAEVRVAPLTDGAVTVSIPDRCLEQSAPITAWVFFVGEASGRTAMELTLPVIPRLKPAIAGSSEEEEKAGDKYDQLFALMGEAYDAIEACKNVEASADEAQASANAAASSASKALLYLSEAGDEAEEAAASASEAKASAEAAEVSRQQADESAESVLASLDQFENQTLRPTYLRENQLIVYSAVASAEGGLIYCKKTGQFFLVELVDRANDSTVYSFGVIRWNGLRTLRTAVTAYTVQASGSTTYSHICYRVQLSPHESDTSDYTGGTPGAVFRLGRFKLQMSGFNSTSSTGEWATVTNSSFTVKLTPLTDTYLE